MISIKVPLLGVRIAGLLSIFFCLFAMDIALVMERRASIELMIQEESVARDIMKHEQLVYLYELDLLTKRTKNLNTRVSFIFNNKDFSSFDARARLRSAVYHDQLTEEYNNGIKNEVCDVR